MDLYLKIENVVTWYHLLITITGLLLNSIVLWVCLSKTYTSKHKDLLQYLSASDLIYSISQALFIHRRFNEHEWKLGNVLCRFTALPHISMAFSVFVVIFIAWDRYRCIVYPFQMEMPHLRKKLIVGVLAFCSVSIYIPSILKLHVVDFFGKKDCVRDLDMETAKYWNLMVFIFLLPVPLLVIIYCYTKIIRKVRKSLKLVSKNSATNTERQFKHNKKISLMLVAIILVFIMTNLPNQTLVLWVIFAPKNNPNVDRKIYLTLYWLSSLVHLHSVINPVIYMVTDCRFQSSIKNSLKSVFNSKKKKKKTLKPRLGVELQLTNTNGKCRHILTTNYGSVAIPGNGGGRNSLHPMDARAMENEVRSSNVTERYTLNTCSRSRKSEPSIRCLKVDWIVNQPADEVIV